MSVKRRIAVIGSNSFSGSDFIDLLLEDEGNDVIGISRSPEKSVLFQPYKCRESPSFRFYQMDLNIHMAPIIELFDSFEPEYVVNFAAQSEVAPSWEHPEQWFQTNAGAVTELAHALKDRHYLKRYVHISSPEVYGTCTGTVREDAPLNPSTPYAASKAAGDLSLFTFVKNFHFPMVMIRSTNVYGAHQQLYKIVPRTIIYLKQGKKIPLHGDGRAVKSWRKGRRWPMQGYRGIGPYVLPVAAAVWGLRIDQARRLREMEAENGRLRRAVHIRDI